jgi:hypothetical protein
MREGRIKSDLENALIVSQAHQPQQVKLQAPKTVHRTNEAQDQVSPLDQASHLDQVNLAQRVVVHSNESKRRSQRLRKFKIKSSKPLLDFKAVSQEEKPSLDVTSVPNVIVM